LAMAAGGVSHVQSVPIVRADSVAKLTVDELGLVLGELANLQLPVGGLGGAVTAGKIVDDDTEDVVAGNVRNGRLEAGDVGDGITVAEN
jgi:hypothetical protein